MDQTSPSSTKPSSPPPAYTELPDASAQTPSSSQAAPVLPSATSFPSHAGYGPTPIAQQTRLVPYYDPHSPYALAEAGARARGRFMGAFLWALLIMLLVGFVTGWEAQENAHRMRLGNWVRVMLSDSWKDR